MGTLVNPRGWRLGFLQNWNIFLSSSLKNFSYLSLVSHNFICIFLRLLPLFFKNVDFFFNFYNIAIVKNSKLTTLIFFYYFKFRKLYFKEKFIFNLSKIKKLKKKKKDKFKNFFFPKELFDKKKFLFLVRDSNFYESDFYSTTNNFINSWSPMNLGKKKKLLINFLFKEFHWSILGYNKKNHKIFKNKSKKIKTKKKKNFFFYFNNIKFNKSFKQKKNNFLKNTSKAFSLTKFGKSKKKKMSLPLVKKHRLKKNVFFSLPNFFYRSYFKNLRLSSNIFLFLLVKRKKALNWRFNLKPFSLFLHSKNYKNKVKKNTKSLFLKKSISSNVKNAFYLNLIFFFFFNKIVSFIKLLFFKILTIFFNQNKVFSLRYTTSNLFADYKLIFLPKKIILESSLVMSYILKKIKVKRLRIRFLIKTLVSILTEKVKNRDLKGFKFQISGRLTKKDRAVYIWERHFKTSLNTKSAKIDYASSIFITKFSSCMFKLWLHHN